MLPALRHLFNGNAVLTPVYRPGVRLLATNTSTESPMAVLRRRTGLAYSLCRRALDSHDQDMAAAEKWLRSEAAKQGWERAQRVAARPAAEGLVAVLQTDSLDIAGGQQRLAAMLELNCETDFVARNDLFARLATRLCRELTRLAIAGTSGAHHQDQGALLARMRYTDDQLARLAPELVVEAIGRLGENIRVSKACVVSTGRPLVGDQLEGDVRLVGYTHAVGGKVQAVDDSSDGHQQPSVMLGKYGTIIALRADKMITESGEEVTAKTDAEVQEIGKQLAQHIIGLKPKTIEPIGGMKATSPTATADGQLPEVAKQVRVDKDDVLADPDVDEESTALLEQQFIFDEDQTVGHYLNDLNVKVLDFVRFECGFNE